MEGTGVLSCVGIGVANGREGEELSDFLETPRTTSDVDNLFSQGVDWWWG